MKYTNKKTKEDLAKMKARFEKKLKEFKTKSLDELKVLFRETKMSSTDKEALIYAADYLMQQKLDKEIGMKITNEVVENEKDS